MAEVRGEGGFGNGDPPVEPGGGIVVADVDMVRRGGDNGRGAEANEGGGANDAT
jgi:hypothetical protein